MDSTAVFTNGQTDSRSTTRHGPRNRCVNERMGSEPPQGRNFDRGSLVTKGSYPSHQLARTESSISSSTVLRKEPQQHSHPTEDGQPGSSYICEQEGGNKVEGPLRLSTEAVGLVHQTFHHSGSTSLARTSEHNCRLREPSPDRLKRLESGSSSVQADHQAAGEVQYRFVRQLPEHQTGPILQLETRPQIPGSGCSGPAMGGSQPIPVSSFLSDRSLLTKVEARRCSSCPPGGTSMATTGMVPCSPGDVNGCSKDTSARPVTGDRPRGKSTPPTGAREAKAGGLAYIRQSLEKQGISEQGAELYCASWRHSTTRAYTSCWQRWIDWCGTRSTDLSKAPVGQIVAFLTDLFKEGKEYSTINSYRSAISAIHSAQIGLDPTLNRFMQGVFNSRPSKPKYTCIWDVDTVLGFMKTMPPLQELSLTKLSWKLVTLLALSNADRASDLQLFDINYLHILENGAEFIVNGLSKTRRSGPPRHVTYPRFESPEICPVGTLEAYVDRTKPIRGNTTALFISTRKPYKQVTTSTLSRWMKCMLEASGIDVKVFKGHSVRTAAASAAHRAGASIRDILKAGDWKRESTFSRFYNKPLRNANSSSFSQIVLNGMCHGDFKHTLVMYAVLSRSRIESLARVY